MALITIGLPVYNGERFLDEALQTLTSQSFSDLEILVSDNASTDATPQILEKWQKIDPRIRIHRQAENIGGWPNFKWVLNNNSSQFFMYAAYDDKWSPNYVERLYSALRHYGDAKLAVGRLATFFENGKEDVQRYVQAPPKGKKRDAIRTMHSGGYYGLFDRFFLIESLEKTKAFKHDWGADFIVPLPALLAGQVVADNEAVYYKRITPLSEARYRPKTAGEQYVVYRDFWAEMLRCLKDAPLSRVQKIRLLPTLARYARNAGKPRRILKAWVREVIKRGGAALTKKRET